MLWVVGLLTSLLTAIYMFRLVFLAFHGAPRSALACRPRHVMTRMDMGMRMRQEATSTPAALICTTRRRRWRSR